MRLQVFFRLKTYHSIKSSEEKQVIMHKSNFQINKLTFSAVREFVMLWDNFIGIAV